MEDPRSNYESFKRFPLPVKVAIIALVAIGELIPIACVAFVVYLIWQHFN